MILLRHSLIEPTGQGTVMLWGIFLLLLILGRVVYAFTKNAGAKAGNGASGSDQSGLEAHGAVHSI